MKRVLGCPAFQVFLFALCVVLFNWPLLTIAPTTDQSALFHYLFSAWAVIVFLLYLSSKGCGD
ncbi:MAG: hypothetical protein ACM3YO_00285 [Bacteroidota bacterium]